MARKIDALIYVEPRKVDGRTVYFPACQRAHALAAIAGAEVLDWDTIGKIKALGFEVEERAPAPMFT